MDIWSVEDWQVISVDFDNVKSIEESKDDDGGGPMMSLEGDLPERVKLVLLGDTQVGKTCLLSRYNQPDEPFKENQSYSIGAAVLSKPIDFGGHRVNASFWDTAGQERFRSMAPHYYRKAKGALLVYDTTNRESFEHVQSWINELRDRGEPNILMIVVGNKTDLTEERVVSEGEGLNFATANDCLFMETSAKTGHNVQELFTGMARGVVRQMKSGLSSPLDISIISLVDDFEPQEASSCCPKCS